MSFLNGSTAEEKMKDLVCHLLDNQITGEDAIAVLFTREEIQEIENLQLEDDW